MKLRIGSGEQAIGGTGAFGFLESVEREFNIPTRQETQVLNSTTQGSLAILGPAQQTMEGGALLGKKLLGKREQDHWTFVFKDVKPSPEEQKALDDFGKRSDLLAFWPYFYGSQPRRKGETWKADTTALTKETKDKTAPTIELTFTLVDVADHNGVRCAHLSFTGFLKAAFGANNGSSLKLDVQGDIWRDIRDLVDVDMNLQGTFSLTGLPAGKANVPEGSTVEVSAPFTLARTVKAVK